MQIRAYKEKDIENLRTICHETATAKEFVENKELVCTLYCDYYYEQEPENIFVAVTKEDEAVGYIICAEDYKKFFSTFNKNYLSKVKKLSKAKALEQRFMPLMYCKVKKKYPAHLHINLLPPAQGKGMGRKLIDTLCKHLAEKGVKGLSLTVGGDNKGAIAFYKKLGFKKVKSIFGMAYVFAKPLL